MNVRIFLREKIRKIMNIQLNFIHSNKKFLQKNTAEIKTTEKRSGNDRCLQGCITDSP